MPFNNKNWFLLRSEQVNQMQYLYPLFHQNEFPILPDAAPHSPVPWTEINDWCNRLRSGDNFARAINRWYILTAFPSLWSSWNTFDCIAMDNFVYGVDLRLQDSSRADPSYVNISEDIGVIKYQMEREILNGILYLFHPANLQFRYMLWCEPRIINLEVVDELFDQFEQKTRHMPSYCVQDQVWYMGQRSHMCQAYQLVRDKILQTNRELSDLYAQQNDWMNLWTLHWLFSKK